MSVEVAAADAAVIAGADDDVRIVLLDPGVDPVEATQPAPAPTAPRRPPPRAWPRCRTRPADRRRPLQPRPRRPLQPPPRSPRDGRAHGRAHGSAHRASCHGGRSDHAVTIVAVAGDACTTTTVAIAAAWSVADDVIVIEADPSGGDLAAWFDLPVTPSLSTVVTRVARRQLGRDRALHPARRVGSAAHPGAGTCRRGAAGGRRGVAIDRAHVRRDAFADRRSSTPAGSSPRRRCTRSSAPPRSRWSCTARPTQSARGGGGAAAAARRPARRVHQHRRPTSSSRSSVRHPFDLDEIEVVHRGVGRCHAARRAARRRAHGGGVRRAHRRVAAPPRTGSRSPRAARALAVTTEQALQSTVGSPVEDGPMSVDSRAVPRRALAPRAVRHRPCGQPARRGDRARRGRSAGRCRPTDGRRWSPTAAASSCSWARG